MMNAMTSDERFKYLLDKDKTDPKDKERIALFYIVANANEGDLFNKIRYIYDFEERCIITECLEVGTIDLCSSAMALIRLGFNLFNGYDDNRCDVKSILSGLDDTNYNIAMQAINMRFKRDIKG